MNKPTENIDNITLEDKNIRWSKWINKELGNKQALAEQCALQGATKGLCMDMTKDGFYIGCEDGSLQLLDKSLKNGVQVVYQNQKHKNPISHIKAPTNKILLTRSQKEEECYLWNLASGSKRPRVRLARIPKDSKIYIDNVDNKLKLTCSHAGSRSIVLRAWDKDITYEVPYFWTTGEDHAGLTAAKAFYVYELSRLEYAQDEFMDMPTQKAIEHFRKCPILTTFEPQVQTAFENFFNEKEMRLKEAAKAK